MARDKRAGWLADLKVGDMVWAPSVRGEMVQAKVESISATGIISTWWGSFEPSGEARPDRGGFTRYGRLMNDAEHDEHVAFTAETPARRKAILEFEASAQTARLRTIAAARWVIDHPEAVEAVEALAATVTA